MLDCHQSLQGTEAKTFNVLGDGGDQLQTLKQLRSLQDRPRPTSWARQTCTQDYTLARTEPSTFFWPASVIWPVLTDTSCRAVGIHSRGWTSRDRKLKPDKTSNRKQGGNDGFPTEGSELDKTILSGLAGQELPLYFINKHAIRYLLIQVLA